MKTASSADSKFDPAFPQMKSPMMTPAQLEMIIAAQSRMVEQIGAINRAWLSSVEKTSSTGSDLAARLLQCSNPVEGIGLCNDWFRQNASRFVSDGLNATRLWMDFCSSAFGTPPGAGAAPRQSSGDGEAGREKQPSSAAA